MLLSLLRAAPRTIRIPQLRATTTKQEDIYQALSRYQEAKRKEEEKRQNESDLINGLLGATIISAIIGYFYFDK